MKIRMLSSAVLLAASSAAFANTPITYSELDSWKSGEATSLSRLSDAEMDETEGNALPLILIGTALATGTVAGGAGYLINTSAPTLAGLAWHAGLGFTTATIGTVVAPTLPATGAILATAGAGFIPLLPQPAPPPSVPGIESCGIFGSCSEFR